MGRVPRRRGVCGADDAVHALDLVEDESAEGGVVVGADDEDDVELAADEGDVDDAGECLELCGDVAPFGLDIEVKPDGLIDRSRCSMTDQGGHGQTVAVARGNGPETDPVAALAAWRTRRGHQPGPLFTRCWKSRIGTEALSGDAIARMLRSCAHDAGLDATRTTAHPLRAGHATTAALGGVPLARIAAQTRHQDLSVLVNRYIRPLEALATTSGRDLGL